MKRCPLMACLLLATSFVTLPTKACIWDSETLAAEMARLPETVDVMTGNFPRHSRAFYEWRVQTARAALKASPNLIPRYNDLAVAQHKLGDNASAIATMMEKERRKPGLYETASNLGTFYIFTGDLKTALEWIDKALKINPNAHFGREKYQKWLVEWVLAGKPGQAVPSEGLDFESAEPVGFANFILFKQGAEDRDALQKKSTDWLKSRFNEARLAVLGMMRFADFNHPLLQEALGDILAAGDHKQDAQHLAAMAYLHAVKKNTEPNQTAILTKKMTASLGLARWSQREADILLKQRISAGSSLAYKVAADESQWIKENKDVSAMFLAKYARRQASVPPGK